MHCQSAALQNVSVDHGGFDIFVSEQFLYGPYVVSSLKKMGGEGVSEGVRGDAFLQFDGARSFANASLKGGFVDVVAGGFACFRVGKSG